MPYNEAITLTKIDELNQKNLALRILETEVSKIRNSLQLLLDVDEVEKNPDGTLKTDQDGQPVLIKVMPMDNDTIEKLTSARRTTVFDKMIAAADAALAKTA